MHKYTHLSRWDFSIFDHLYKGMQLILQFSELQRSHRLSSHDSSDNTCILMHYLRLFYLCLEVLNEFKELW